MFKHAANVLNTCKPDIKYFLNSLKNMQQLNNWFRTSLANVQFSFYFMIKTYQNQQFCPKPYSAE